jgi:glyoxylase-like metal-dependent hydrolase (beta-lactamase superfamily II)
MTYTGHVEPGGPAAVRELQSLRLSKLSVGPVDNNAYLLECRRTGALLLVDAAAEPDRILTEVGSRTLERVVTTHRHADHWQALSHVVDRTGARTAAGTDDAPAIPVPTDDLLDDGAVVTVGDVHLEVIRLVGHTPGSVALLYDDPAGPAHLFTGDSLFPGGVGKTAGPEQFRSLLDDVERKVFGRLPDDTWFYPGHGDDSTLGLERPNLAEWRSRGW